jgi:hypothetical protein
MCFRLQVSQKTSGILDGLKLGLCELTHLKLNGSSTLSTSFWKVYVLVSTAVTYL